MKNKNQIKSALYKSCEEYINQRIDTIEQGLISIQESRNNETKSSAGDKFETGRAMMQMEEEKNIKQLSEAIIVKNELLKIKLERTIKRIETGSLVTTDRGEYFISIGIGKVELNGQLYYCVSEQSPIGLALKDKRVGDEIDFNGSNLKIKDIS